MHTGPSVDDGRRFEFAGHQRRQIDVGLERRARLAQRIGGAVELAGAIVAAADQGAHRAVGLEDDDGSLLGMILLAELAQAVFQRFFGLPLDARIKRRADRQHAVVAEFAGLRQFLHFLERPVEIPVGGGDAVAVHGRRGVLRAPKTWPSVMKPASTRFCRTSLARGARCRQIDVRRDILSAP